MGAETVRESDEGYRGQLRVGRRDAGRGRVQTPPSMRTLQVTIFAALLMVFRFFVKLVDVDPGPNAVLDPPAAQKHNNMRFARSFGVVLAPLVAALRHVLVTAIHRRGLGSHRSRVGVASPRSFREHGVRSRVGHARELLPIDEGAGDVSASRRRVGNTRFIKVETTHTDSRSIARTNE